MRKSISTQTKLAMLVLAMSSVAAAPAAVAADEPAAKSTAANPCAPKKKKSGNPCAPANPCAAKKKKTAEN